MISCEFLHTVSVSLSRATGNSAAFSGINIIFTGNLAQLPPVEETWLSAYVDPTRASTSDHFQRHVKGKILWLSISTVVLLEKINRQTGEENMRFVELLTRLHNGDCNISDYQILQRRIVSPLNNVVHWNLQPNELTPVIVSDNTTKDRINIKMARGYAAKTGLPLHEYLAVD
ncbi:hypothetical protein F5887DRAFT_840913, partial [Amanita rubescens]